MSDDMMLIMPQCAIRIIDGLCLSLGAESSRRRWGNDGLNFSGKPSFSTSARKSRFFNLNLGWPSVIPLDSCLEMKLSGFFSGIRGSTFSTHSIQSMEFFLSFLWPYRYFMLSIAYFAVFLKSIYVLDNCCNVGWGQRSYNDPCFYPFRPGCTLLGFDDLGLYGPEK